MKNIDDSFKKPGSVPFNWEIRPGVPKTQNPSGDPLFEYGSRKQHQRTKLLKPPPAGSYFRPDFEPRPPVVSYRSPQHTSNSRRFGLRVLARPDIVSPTGCFPSTKNAAGKRSGGSRSRPEHGYYSDPDIPSPWSVSSRKSTASPLSSSFASYQSSPRPSDAVWASFGLF